MMLRKFFDGLVHWNRKPILCVSLGAWCRTSWQLKKYCEQRGHYFIPSPFDWTIAPFASLELAAKDPVRFADLCLRDDGLEISSVGSLQCGMTGIIFHHGLPPDFVKRISAKGPIDIQLGKSEIRRERQRFLHTFDKLRGLNALGTSYPILFVRWQRSGFPDVEIPNVFEGESTASLLESIRNITGLSKFFLLTVISKSEPASVREISQPIISFAAQDRAFHVELSERRLGRRSKELPFQGDSDSWGRTLKALEYIISNMHG